MTEKVNHPGGAEGPILTDQGGSLITPVLMCFWGNHRCKHFGVHDFHYPYCSGQPSENNDGSAKDTGGRNYTYPWPNAGTHIFRNTPNKGCPYRKGDHDG